MSLSVNDRFMAVTQKPTNYESKSSALDTIRGSRPIRISPCAWMTYAWMLQHSKFNVNDCEKHYYLYNTSFKNADIAADTGYRADTISMSKRDLIDWGLIEKQKIDGKLVWFINADPRYFAMAAMPLKVLGLFFSIKSSVFPYKESLIRTYGVLKLAYRGGADSYTISAIMDVLHKKRSDMDARLEVMTCVGLLRELGLIKVEEFHYHNKFGKECVKYKILEITTDMSKIVPYLEDGIDDEILAEVQNGAEKQMRDGLLEEN